MLNNKRVLAMLVFMVMLFAGLSIVSTFEAGAHAGHPQKKLFDDRWYQQVSGGDYAAWMTLSTSQPWLECGSSAADCGSRWIDPLNAAVNDWNGQNTTVDLAIQPDWDLDYDVNIIVDDLVLGDPDLLGLAVFWDSSYDVCVLTCTIWYGWALMSDLEHAGAYGTANARQATISHELGHLFSLRHESVNADESVLYDCEVDDTGSIPVSIMSYDCIDPVSLGGQGIYTVQPWDTCGVNHAYHDPTIGYATCNPFTNTSFDGSYQVSVVDTTPGGPRATTTTFFVPHPGNINWDSLIQFDPAGTITQTCNTGRDGSGRATTHTAGGACLRATDLAGSVSMNLHIGTLNSLCILNWILDFNLFAVPTPDNPADPRASTNIAYTQPQGTADRFARWGTSPIGVGGGTPVAYTGANADADNIAFKNYPAFLLDLFDADGPAGGGKPLVPLAVYGGISKLAGTVSTPIYIVTFEPGALAAEFYPPNPLGRATANLGYASQTVLYDPTQANPNPSPITAFCSTSVATALNATVGGVTRATNPAAGTHLNLAWVASERDLDNDGIENALDTCPKDVNIDGDPRETGNNPDGDMLDSVCDPNPGSFDGNQYSDAGWYNTQDNCPLVSNPGQSDSELSLGVAPGYTGGRSNDGGPLGDDLGDVCDAGTVNVTYNGINYPALALNSTVANGRWQARGFVVPICYGATDADGDGYCASDTDAFDTAVGDNAIKHNAWTTDTDLNVVLGKTSTLGSGSWDTDSAGGVSIAGGGGVGDAGYDSDWLETYVGIDARQPCSLSSTLSDEPLDAWLFDTNDDRKATLGDILAISPFFLQAATTDGHKRFDWNADGSVSLGDVLSIAPVFLKKCVPVVLPQ